jgi:hypothetical protein
MSNGIDPIYFKELSEKDPGEICRNALCNYDSKKRCFILNFFGEEYLIMPLERRITKLLATDYEVDILTGLTIIYYLLYSKDIRVTGEWISEKDIPGGTMFFTGPHTIPTNLIDKRFVNISDFSSRSEKLAGNRIDMGDSAFAFRVLPRVPVAVIYWKGDNEYPVQTKLLFDRSISDHLTPDIIFGMTVEVCKRISG